MIFAAIGTGWNINFLLRMSSKKEGKPLGCNEIKSMSKHIGLADGMVHQLPGKRHQPVDLGIAPDRRFPCSPME